MNDLTLPALRQLHRLIGRLGAELDLAATLQSVVDGVVEGLGFRVAVVNLVHDDGTVEVVSVAGSDEARQALLGGRGRLDDWERSLAQAEPRGMLRFEGPDAAVDDSIPTWVPDLPESADEGAWHPMDALYAPLRSPTGRLVGVLSVDLPVDGRRPGPQQCELLEMFAVQAAIAIDNARLAEALRAEQSRLQASEESFRLAFDNAPVGMSIIDLSPGREGRFLNVNAAMCLTLGYQREDLLGRTFADITHPLHHDEDAQAMARAIAGEDDPYQSDKRYVRADGRTVWVSVRTSVVRDTDGKALYAITQFEDVSDRRALQQELTRRARHDPLTGLLNRSALHERLGETIESARRTGDSGAVLFCDLDHFKPVNDIHGHAIGDQVLAIIARRLESQVRAGDTVARYGGDEFVVVADGLGGLDLDDLVQRLSDSVAQPVDVEGTSVTVALSVGTVMVTGRVGETVADLLASADVEMYRRKRPR